MSALTQFIRDEEGATAIEYGLIAALISVIIIAALLFLSAAMENTFGYISDAVEDAANASSS